METATLIDVLRVQAAARGDDVLYRFLDDGERAGSSMTFASVDRRARQIGAALQRRFAPASRLLLVVPPGPDVIGGFFGALCGGMVPVPVYPPQERAAVAAVGKIAADAAVGGVLTSRALLDQMAAAGLPFGGAFDAVVLDDLTGDPDAWSDPRAGGDDLAFLQYTSGSTGDPKGVMVAHGGLLTTIDDIDRAFHHDRDSVLVSWLPTYHDMGLIYGVLLPLRMGFSCYLMPPAAFLRRPIRWLRAMSAYGGTHSASPNFGYDLCVRKTTPEERASLDLSRWRVASNGAEPIREATMLDFAEAFAGAGFRFDAFTPSYGLAEATLKVATARAESPPVVIGVDARALEERRVVDDGSGQVRRLVGCGHSDIGAEIRIVDPATAELCPPGTVGEIWVKSRSVAKGYWRRPEQTRQTFQATTADGRGPFLRTGDLGFVADGELFVTGRVKDLIVLRGRNYYPHDVEYAAESSSPALRRGCATAFTVDDGAEQSVVLLLEAQPEHAAGNELRDVIREARNAATRDTGVALDAIVVFPAGTLPKTSSGKVRRGASRELYLAGRGGAIAEWHRA